MAKINPNEVREAYDKTGLGLVTGMFARKRGDECEACAITVLLVARGTNFNDLHKMSDYDLRRLACNVLGVSRQYLDNFIEGFDGERLGSRGSASNDGHRAYCAAVGIE